MRPKLVVLCIAGVMAFTGCGNKVQEEETEKIESAERAERDVDNIPLSEMTYDDLMIKYNTVAGHDERDTIVGNFTGKGIDTLYVRYDETKEDGERWQFYAESNNRSIPRFNMSGCISISPKLVNEGDLDGNGTCEVGYLHTWVSSQWRYYRIYTLVNGEWRNLIQGEYLNTPVCLRRSGLEIAKCCGQKGKVLVNYFYEGLNDSGTASIHEIRDTIVNVRFTTIIDD